MPRCHLPAGTDHRGGELRASGDPRPRGPARLRTPVGRHPLGPLCATIKIHLFDPVHLHFPKRPRVTTTHATIKQQAIWGLEKKKKAPRPTACILHVAESLSRVRLLGTPWTSSPPGSSVHGILQARILQQVVISFSRASSQRTDQTCVS